MSQEGQDKIEGDVRQDVERAADTNIDEDPANRDPISGQTGSHPVGTGIGAAAVGAAATAIGAVGGPVGAVVGAVVGSVVGGLVGKSAAEQVNPTHEEGYQGAISGKSDIGITSEFERPYEVNSSSALGQDEFRYADRDAWDRLDWSAQVREENEYWRDQYNFQTYYQSGLTYEDYEPAYRTGYEGFAHFYQDGKTYEEVEPQLQRQFGLNAATSRLSWEQAKGAVRDAWYRMEHIFRNR